MCVIRWFRFGIFRTKCTNEWVRNKWFTGKTVFSRCMHKHKHKNIKINSAHRKFIASALSEEQATNKILLVLYVNTVLSLHQNNNNINWRLSWWTYIWVSTEVQSTRRGSKTPPLLLQIQMIEVRTAKHSKLAQNVSNAWQQHLHICLIKCNRLIAEHTGEWTATLGNNV